MTTGERRPTTEYLTAKSAKSAKDWEKKDEG